MREYKLATNNGPNHLHGGVKGFDKQMWELKPFTTPAGTVGLMLTYRSKDGEEGYPGNLDVVVKYSLTDENELRIDYEAKTDKATPVNLTNHTYFNLAGSGDVLGHVAHIMGSKYTPGDKDLLPTGKIESVKGTPFDFTEPKAIGKDLAAAGGDPVGYDLNYVVDTAGKLALVARVTEPTTGRVMEVFTMEPGVQFYTGNFLDGTVTGKGGTVYKKHAGFCLETQHYPDSPNRPEWPTTILKPGDTYKTTTVYRFSVKK